MLPKGLKDRLRRKRSDSRTEDCSASGDDLHGRPDTGDSPPCRPPPPPPLKPPLLLDKPWRTLDWSKHENLKDNLRRFRISTPDVEYLRILVHGPVGAGKSSFINSIDSIFQGRMTSTALVATATDHSFTKKFKTHYINDQSHKSFLPFAICDVMGLENCEGVRTDDLINILQGCIKEGYMFNPANPCSKCDRHYNRHPTLKDKIHCLVSVISAVSITTIDDAVINKMRRVRARVDRIPQVVVLTKVDDICPKVAEDITIIYRSKKIRAKMEECSNRLGIPMNCIFPVKNYSEEIDLINEVDVLLLSALKHILNYANDHVAKMAPPPANMRSSRRQHVNFEDSMMEHGHHVNMRQSRHGQYTDTEDSMMEHGHHVNMRQSRHGQYTGSEDSMMEHGHPANVRSSRHDLHIVFDVNMRERNWTDV